MYWQTIINIADGQLQNVANEHCALYLYHEKATDYTAIHRNTISNTLTTFPCA